ncbi:MAG: threonine--tRNA ligase [Anaerovibrio sp.]|uniref:threonine--tRNA ligase n=1 Tax=Anaerovibrio TaxID=82373 RepID=UPI002E77E5EC|nr:threonine--tRNA ligase [Anaerovibrio sp.]MBQ2409897.1 threonine--tRNA ligase [Selenomonadaceae bacterium]MBQ5585884.1 threonine--tRNA ligase [Selenomonadaceae bacterium]MBQ5650134.1 threonine--tRNA ligase [Selenomonadaceae bacterium]MBQ5732387.1 threonine--tRNA ligase [Selenomonadaceae bacterium]MBQ5920045.1 threonine--tRNA ligase [Selenomonadaceae bacterium]
MIKLTMPDGSIREAEAGISALELVKSISNSLAKKVLAVSIDDKTMDLTTVLDRDCKVQFLTFEDEGGRHALRHTASHILAQAIKRLYKDENVQLAIGPAIENGFYYDIDMEKRLTEDDLKDIEKEMNKIVKENLKLERKLVSRQEALDMFGAAGENYKVELINDLPEDAEISLYTQGEFTDLCAGPHVVSTGKVKALKLQSVAGAYWRGSEKNKMLQRVYGTAFEKKDELDAYLKMLEEAAKRDHRKLGKELDLFSIHEEGPGFPFFHPNGMVIRNELINYWREVHRRYGYQEIKTPMILNRQLWEQSGHWAHYKENMYFTEIDGEDYAIKPMNCPGGMLVYKTQQHSYRDLPLRAGELGLVHRHELSGALHGLFRVRNFTQDDAHIFMTPEQIEGEIQNVINLFDEVYSTFGLKYHAELSTRPEDSMGSDEMWELATNGLRNALEHRGLDYIVNEGDGAFYGPKIDFHLKDSIGRTWQCGTIQLDMQLPEKFDLTYVGEDGQKHRPVMIHRVVYGSIERFIGILIENYAGAFPTWLAPVQVKILPITDRHMDYAFELKKKMFDLGLRVEVDDRNEKVGYKMREAQVKKIPYMLVVGDQEMESGTVNMRKHGEKDTATMPVDEFIAYIQKNIADKSEAY